MFRVICTSALILESPVDNRNNRGGIIGPQSLQEGYLDFHGMFRAVGMVGKSEGRALRELADSPLVNGNLAQGGLKSCFL